VEVVEFTFDLGLHDVIHGSLLVLCASGDGAIVIGCICPGQIVIYFVSFHFVDTLGRGLPGVAPPVAKAYRGAPDYGCCLKFLKYSLPRADARKGMATFIPTAASRM
jgi:hypothetical protein